MGHGGAAGTVWGMTDPTGEVSASWWPTTVWAACLSAAGLMVDVGADEAPGEVLVPPREDVAVLIAAVMYRQVQRRCLAAGDGDIDAVREVWILGPDGVVNALETAAFSALEDAPNVAAASDRKSVV